LIGLDDELSALREAVNRLRASVSRPVCTGTRLGGFSYQPTDRRVLGRTAPKARCCCTRSAGDDR
jgi:hypothetical protein